MNNYLMWIGKEHYPTIEDWCGEAIARGISKRLSGPAVAKKLVDGDSVVYVAHDEGDYYDCPDCVGEMQCPECRKVNKQIFDMEELCEICGKYTLSQLRVIVEDEKESKVRRNRVRRLIKLIESRDDCELCHGEGTCKGGTGGYVVIDNSEKTRMDYRQYNYWLHQPKLFDAEKEVNEKHMCERCGGTGRLPHAKIFGLFVPCEIEYIFNPGDSEELIKKIKEDFKLVTTEELGEEEARGCGTRVPGGFYAVTRSIANPAAEEKIKQLVDAGVLKPGSTTVHGSFIRFLEPIEVNEKRFRGIKKWDPSALVSDAADDVLDAMK